MGLKKENINSIRILGIDPGSRYTGYGIIDSVSNKITHVTHGTVSLQNSKDTPVEKRFLKLYQELNPVIEKFHPDVVAIEKVFFAKNAQSAIKLGQARGAVLLIAGINHLTVYEYNPTEIKRSLSGHGRSDKTQVAKMVELILGKQEFETEDASDALAIAICHAQMAFSKLKTTTLKPKKKISLAQAVGVEKIR